MGCHHYDLTCWSSSSKIIDKPPFVWMHSNKQTIVAVHRIEMSKTQSQLYVILSRQVNNHTPNEPSQPNFASVTWVFEGRTVIVIIIVMISRGTFLNNQPWKQRCERAQIWNREEESVLFLTNIQTHIHQWKIHVYIHILRTYVYTQIYIHIQTHAWAYTSMYMRPHHSHAHSHAPHIKIVRPHSNISAPHARANVPISSVGSLA